MTELLAFLDKNALGIALLLTVCCYQLGRRVDLSDLSLPESFTLRIEHVPPVEDTDDDVDYVASTAYQIVGDLADRAGLFEHPEVTRALDWLSGGYRTSDEMLPFGEGLPEASEIEDTIVAPMRARKDDAYEERNKVVAALARLFPSGTARTAIPGWSDDWHGCVYIDLPTGQVSWHFHDSQAHLFADLPAYGGTWDGHDTPEKYRRLAALAAVSRV